MLLRVEHHDAHGDGVQDVSVELFALLHQQLLGSHQAAELVERVLQDAFAARGTSCGQAEGVVAVADGFQHQAAAPAYQAVQAKVGVCGGSQQDKAGQHQGAAAMCRAQRQGCGGGHQHGGAQQ